MKKSTWLKKSLSFILTACIFTAVPFVTSTAAETQSGVVSENRSKIGSDLLQKMNNLSEDEKISVSVWVSDINQSDIRPRTESMLLDAIESGEVSQDAIDTVFGGNPKSAKVTAAEMNKVIDAKRKAVWELLAENNNNIYDALRGSLLKNSELISISKSIPCINLYLTKDEITDLENSEYVEEMLYLDMGLKFEDSDASRFTVTEQDGNIIYQDSVAYTPGRTFENPEYLYLTTGKNSDGSEFVVLDNFKRYGYAGDSLSYTVTGDIVTKCNVSLSDILFIYQNDTLYTLTEAYDAGVMEDKAFYQAITEYFENPAPSLARFVKPYCDVMLLGDINGDNKVDITDATFLQMYIANKKSVKIKDMVIANVNGDKKININDVTAIQKKSAKLIDSFALNRPNVPFGF